MNILRRGYRNFLGDLQQSFTLKATFVIACLAFVIAMLAITGAHFS